MKTPTETLITALEKLSEDIHTDDGVVNACLAEAAMRMREMREIGNELSTCASQLGWTSSDDPKWFFRSENAVEKWKELTK